MGTARKKCPGRDRPFLRFGHFYLVKWTKIGTLPEEEVQSPNPIETLKMALLLRKSEKIADLLTTFGSLVLRDLRAEPT